MLSAVSPVLPVYKRSPLEITHGEGVYIFTRDGRRYLDCASGVAVNALGHCHPKLKNALQEQSEKIWHLSNLFRIPGLEEFAQELTAKTFADTVFFCNSGVEANECLFKMVRKYHDATGNPERFRIITFSGAFHGRSLAAIWASKRDAYMQEGFGPPVEGFDNVTWGDLDAVDRAITNETAAILLEPVQGDGGIRVANQEFFKALKQRCDQHGLLFCLDEVQSGMGRTGSLYAHEQYGITPDIMSSAKGLGGGFPLGACLATAKAAQGMVLGTHGSTYGGNALAMAVGRTVLAEVSKPEFLAHVKKISMILKEKLEAVALAYPQIISEVRGMGLLLGIKTVGDNKLFAEKLSCSGLLTAPAADSVLRIIPPLIITEEQVEELMSMIEKTCAKEA